MDQQRWELIERSISGLSAQDKLELVARIIQTVQAEADSSPAEDTDEAPRTVSTHKRIWEVADELRKTIPEDEWKKLPTDGADQLDHYIYGSPKRQP